MGLLARSTEILLAKGVPVRILNLDALIEVKENGEKDRAVLPILRRTLEETSRPLPMVAVLKDVWNRDHRERSPPQLQK